MIENLYSTLEAVGFHHPLHPVFTHGPMGMVIGMLLFGLLSLKWQHKHFDLAAYYCSVVALISIFPTALFGVLDWLNFLEGEWMTLIIIKLILTVVLFTLVTASVILRNKGASQLKLVVFYVLCMACAGGLGYSGGDLVFG